jgi:hypothetical protein
VSKKSLICSAPHVGACSFTALVSDAIPLVEMIHAAWWRANYVVFGRNWRQTVVVMMAGLSQLLNVVALSLTAPIQLEGHPVVWFVVLPFVGAKV